MRQDLLEADIMGLMMELGHVIHSLSLCSLCINDPC